MNKRIFGGLPELSRVRWLTALGLGSLWLLMAAYAFGLGALSVQCAGTVCSFSLDGLKTNASPIIAIGAVVDGILFFGLQALISALCIGAASATADAVGVRLKARYAVIVTVVAALSVGLIFGVRGAIANGGPPNF